MRFCCIIPVLVIALICTIHLKVKNYSDLTNTTCRHVDCKLKLTVKVKKVLPNLIKGWGVCYHANMIGAHKRTCVDHQNMPNYHTSIYHEWVCVCVAALKAIAIKDMCHLWLADLYIPQRSWSGKEWLPFILVWHGKSMGLSCIYHCKALFVWDIAFPNASYQFALPLP